MTDPTPDPRDDRAEQAFREALQHDADRFEPARLDPVGRRSRTWPAVLAAAAAVVLVAGLVVTLTGGPSETPVAGGDGSETGEPVALPTSAWQPGQGGEEALLGGRLSYAPGCVTVGSALVVWPQGYTARLVDGLLEIRDDGGDVVAREGDDVSASGGFWNGPRGGRQACTGTDGSFSVQSDVEVTMPALVEPVDLDTSDWVPGDSGMDALATGRLSLTDGCVTLGSSGVLWPRDFTAESLGGRIVLRNPDGAVVAREGDQVEVGGGHDDSYDLPCGGDPGGEGAFVVQSDVEVVPPEAMLPTDGTPGTRTVRLDGVAVDVPADWADGDGPQSDWCADSMSFPTEPFVETGGGRVLLIDCPPNDAPTGFPDGPEGQWAPHLELLPLAELAESTPDGETVYRGWTLATRTVGTVHVRLLFDDATAADAEEILASIRQAGSDPVPPDCQRPTAGRGEVLVVEAVECGANGFEARIVRVQVGRRVGAALDTAVRAWGEDTGTPVNAVTVENGLAVVDVDVVGWQSTSGSAENVRMSLAAMAFQFAEVESVEYRWNGDCQAFSRKFEGDQCQTITRAEFEQTWRFGELPY